MITGSSAPSFPFTASSFLATSLPSSAISTSPVITQNITGCPLNDTTLSVSLIIFYSLVFLFGLVGNLFALWVFLFLHSSRNSVRVFLINCAVADLVLLACLPFRVLYHVNGNKWGLGSVACKVVGNLFYMNMYISIMLLGLISLDRYLRLKGKGRAWRGLALTVWGHSLPWSWMACGTLWGLSLMGLVSMIATAEDEENRNQCFHYKQRHTVRGKAYFNAILVALFWLIFIMLVVSYAKIAIRLLRLSRDKPDLPNAQKYQRTAKKSFFILFLFTVCFGPYHAFRPIYIFSQLSETETCYRQLMDHTNEVMLLFSAFNSCLDPVMYFLLSGSVRKTALQALEQCLRNRLLSRHDATSNSSTIDLRRTSVPVVLQNPQLNTLNITPRNSIYIIDSSPCQTGLTLLPPTNQQ